MPPPGRRRRRSIGTGRPLFGLARISALLQLGLLGLGLAGGESTDPGPGHCPSAAADGLSSFQRTMRAYPWRALEAAVSASETKAVDALAEQMLEALKPFLLLPPMEAPTTAVTDPTTASSSSSSSSVGWLSAALAALWPWRWGPNNEATAWCEGLLGGCPPPLPRPASLDCSAYPAAGFTGQRRAVPARVAHAIQFAFDADVLEVLLWEIGDLVDVVFLLEGTRTHNRGLSKPLLWEELKRQPRFRPFTDKVVHLIMDDAAALVNRSAPTGMWELENRQERARWVRFAEWNAFHGGYFGQDDLVGFGDADNIPSRQNIHLLRHCELNASAVAAVDIGGWMPWGSLKDAFRPDHNVGGRRWTYADPTYWRVGAATQFAAAAPSSSSSSSSSSSKGPRVPTRLRGKSGHYMLGGVHLTDPPYLPFLLAKIIACTECGDGFAARLPLLRQHLENATAASVRALQRKLNRFGPGHKDRIFPVTAVPKQLEGIYHVPWYLERLAGRYAYWWDPGLGEPRLEADWGW